MSFESLVFNIQAVRWDCSVEPNLCWAQMHPSVCVQVPSSAGRNKEQIRDGQYNQYELCVCVYIHLHILSPVKI